MYTLNNAWGAYSLMVGGGLLADEGDGCSLVADVGGSSILIADVGDSNIPIAGVGGCDILMGIEKIAQ